MNDMDMLQDYACWWTTIYMYTLTKMVDSYRSDHESCDPLHVYA